MLTRTARRPRVPVWLISFVPFAVIVILVVGLEYHSRSSFLTRVSPRVCDEVRQASAQGGSPSPFGAVTSCTILDRGVLPWGAIDGRVYLLLGTATGAAAIRVDYSRLDRGSQYRSEAVELGASDAPGVTGKAAGRLRKDIDARGGPASRTWVIHYGDG
jgi:hypothetical protein